MPTIKITDAQIQSIKVKAAHNPEGVYIATLSSRGTYQVIHFQDINRPFVAIYLRNLPNDTDWVQYVAADKSVIRAAR